MDFLLGVPIPGRVCVPFAREVAPWDEKPDTSDGEGNELCLRGVRITFYYWRGIFLKEPTVFGT
jgi:hypothetical protein